MQRFQFHPVIAAWFERKFGSPTAPQEQGWPPIRSGAHTLIAAPTGSGKTLAAFLASLDALFQAGLKTDLPDEIQVVYVSPLKALSNDIHKILVTTPESLYLLLTSESGRKMLGTVRTLIVDEIHAVVGNRRGSHLALSIERLAALVEHPLQRIGLSATRTYQFHVTDGIACFSIATHGDFADVFDRGKTITNGILL